MATISPFLATNAHSGQDLKVKASSSIFWVPVGSGKLQELSDYGVAIGGQISVMGYKGDLNIALNLTDQDATAQRGNCVVKLNQWGDENAVYSIGKGGKQLIVDAVLEGNKQRIAISPCNDGNQTECMLKGAVNQMVHLEPN